MATMLPYDRFNRLFGVIRASQLLTPKVQRIERIALPRGSVLHYLPENETEIGPSHSNLLLQSATRLIYIDHIKELTTSEGNPRSTYVLPGPLAQQYRRNNMQIRPLSNYDMATRELMNVVVINYSFLGKMYKYMRSALSMYWFWKNIRNTLWDTINNLNTLNERHHFVVLDIPRVLPTLAKFRAAEKRLSPELAKIFNSRERLDVLDVFTWLGENRADSSMNRLNPDKYAITNLIIRKDTGWMMVNVGQLNNWRKDKSVSMESISADTGLSITVGRLVDGEYVVKDGVVMASSLESLNIAYADGTSEDVSLLGVSLEAAATGVDPKVMQIRFLSLLLKVIQQTNPVIGVDVPPSEEEAVDRAERDESELVDDKETDLQIFNDADESNLFIDEEETLSEDLDKAAEAEEKAIMTDEDGELIIESSQPVTQDIPHAIGNRNIEQTLTGSIDSKVEELQGKGLLSTAEARRMQRKATTFRTMESPWDPTQTVEEAMVITREDLVFAETTDYPDTDAVKDKSMLKSTVEMMDSQYVEKVMKKDILNCVMSVQKAGIAVTSYNIRVVEDAVSNYEVHTIGFTPVTGKPSTIQIRVPIVDKKGVYVSNGQRYRLRAQKADVPIRKVNPSRVALSSYYAKVFIDRSERSVFNYDSWITKQIVAKGLDKEDLSITDLRIASVADNSLDLPRIYSIIGERVLSFNANGGVYWFDYANRVKSKLFTETELAEIESKYKGWVAVGRKGSLFIMLDKYDVFHEVTLHGNRQVQLGQIEDIIGISKEKSPVSVAEISIFGKTIPIAMALGYLIGFDELLKKTKAKYRVVPLGDRVQITDDEYAIKFLDETLVFDKLDLRNSLIFGGMLQYHRNIRNYSRHSFNNKDVYFNVLEANNVGLRYLRELDLMNAMFVDPITKGILEWMKEPTEFIPLLMRACELLITRYVPVAVEGGDGVVQGLERAKGYERIPGAIYSELVRSIRVYNSRGASNNSQVSMNPHEVWTNIVQDPAAAIVDDINPIQNLKQKEIITYGGRGGRSSRSMTAEARLYKESDLGFISESTVDSGDVAVITYMTPNANLTSVRGTVRTYDRESDGSSSIVSTAALISPCSDRDDPKRVNFVGIQQSHVIATKGYRESPLSTGYDQVIAHRVDDLFAQTAEQTGEVVERTDDHLVIQYEDGTREHVDLTTQYGISTGSVFPHEQSSTFQLGDTVQKGDIIKYNAGFFKPSRFHPRQVMWKAGVIARTALTEASYTLEDSSAIDDWLSEQLTARVTKVKTVVVRFDQTIRNLVKVGDTTDISSILCTIEDAVTADSGLFNEEDLDTLRLLGSATPKAGVTGVVEKIEVFYHGDPDDMSESLTGIVQTGDRERRRKSKRLGKPNITGQVDQSLRIDGSGLDLDHVAIKIYITYEEGMGVGDKAVFCNQMKTVIGHRLSGINETESGRALNAIFGAKSVMDRIVLSALIMGMSVAVQTAIGEKAAEMWMSNDKT